MKRMPHAGIMYHATKEPVYRGPSQETRAREYMKFYNNMIKRGAEVFDRMPSFTYFKFTGTPWHP